MKRTSVLSPLFAILFAVAIVLSGCTAGSLTGPELQNAEKTTISAEQDHNAALNGGDGGGTETGAGHNVGSQNE